MEGNTKEFSNFDPAQLCVPVGSHLPTTDKLQNQHKVKTVDLEYQWEKKYADIRSKLNKGMGLHFNAAEPSAYRR